MSSHEGVSCDACLKGNFSGKRYKCLICYDYDLCAACYEANMTSTHHSLDHPMQCILTRADFDLFYGGESFSLEQQLSYTCPLCGRHGFTDVLLQEHVGMDHQDASLEVICPICACFPTGDPSHVIDDLATHLLLEHRASSEIDAQLGDIRAIRRMPHRGRGMAGPRTRRGNTRVQSNGASTLPVLSPGVRDRELMDPIAELLSQLSSARSRVAAAQSISSQLHQLEIQLQSSRYGTTRQAQSDRLLSSLGETARTTVTIPASFVRPSGTSQVPAEMLAPAAVGEGGGNRGGSSGGGSSSTEGSGRSDRSGFLLSRVRDDVGSESERQLKESSRADKSLFVQELLLTLLAEEGTKESEKTGEATHRAPAAAAAETPKLAPAVTPVRKEVSATQVVGGGLVSSVATRPASVDENHVPVSNGLTVSDGRIPANRNTAKPKSSAVGRSGKEQTASAKRTDC